MVFRTGAEFDDAKGVGGAGTLLPAGDYDDVVPIVEETTSATVIDGAADTAVHILGPECCVGL